MSAVRQYGAGVAVPAKLAAGKRRRQVRRAPVLDRLQLATRVAVFALVAVVLALMYQGERWMLEGPSAAADPSLIAMCAFDTVGDVPDQACVRARSINVGEVQ